MGVRTTHRYWNSGVFVGMLNSSLEAVVVVTEEALAIKTRAANVRRIPESERWDADRILGMRAVPWSPDGSGIAFDIQVGMERPAEMVAHSHGKVLMENKSSEDLPSQSGLRTVGVPVPENWSGTTASSQRSMSEEK